MYRVSSKWKSTIDTCNEVIYKLNIINFCYHRVQISPVHVKAVCCARLILSVGFFKSVKLFTERSHLEVGAQKKMVKGPAGCAAKFRTALGIASLVSAFRILPEDATRATTPAPARAAFCPKAEYYRSKKILVTRKKYENYR